jgi:hypothetical protein
VLLASCDVDLLADDVGVLTNAARDCDLPVPTGTLLGAKAKAVKGSNRKEEAAAPMVSLKFIFFGLFLFYNYTCTCNRRDETNANQI